MTRVAGAVLADLLDPVATVGLGRQGPVLGAAVPKAAIDEYGHLLRSEDEVRPDGPVRADSDRAIDAVAKSPTVQLRPHCELGSRVAAPVRLHYLAARRGGLVPGILPFAAVRDAILLRPMNHEVQDRLELEPDASHRKKLDRDFLRRKKRPTPAVGPDFEIVDLFSGCGGMTIGAIEGAERAGREAGLALAIDNDPAPLDVLRRSLGVPERCTQVADLADALGPISGSSTAAEQSLFAGIAKGCLLLAGPPCQGHSALNNHTRHDDPRNDLYLSVGRVARMLEPKAVIIENVRSVGSDRRSSVDRCTSVLEELGYHVEPRRIDLSTIGVPQRRVRHVLVATKARPFQWDVPSIPERDLRWAIGDLVAAEDTTPLDTPSKATPLNKERMQWLIDEGEYDLPDAQRPICHQSDHSYRSMYGRLRWDSPAQTITSGFGSMGQGRYVHPERPRTLTPHEAARLQCLPDFIDFTGVEKRTKLAEMIGNVAPPLLTAFLVEALTAQDLL